MYRLLKSVTEEAIASLREACKNHPDYLEGKSLFQETEWLAKSLMLVHDLGMRLKDRMVTEGIEFHPAYIQLIKQYDPSVLLEAEPVEKEPAPPKMDVCTPKVEMESAQPLSAPVVPADKKTDFAAAPPEVSPVAKPARPAPPPVRTNPSAIAMPTPLDRGELQQEIVGTQGDLRKMSRILRRRLGWGIQHCGTRHPTIIDANGNPVAPVPTTGHAGRGTLGNVAASVCMAAAAQGLV